MAFPAEKASKPWVNMPGRPGKKLTLAEEHDLIRAAQQGDRKAADKLIRYYQPVAVQRAKQVVWFTGAVRQEDDLVQIALMTLFEKIKDYDFAYIAKRQKTEPAYRGARLANYAFREMRRRMLAHACKNLEIVACATTSAAHAAHKRLDAGMPAEEVALRFGLKLATVEHLGRHTVSLDEWCADSVDDTASAAEDLEDSQRRGEIIKTCWFALKPLHRLALALFHYETKRDVRRRALQLKNLTDLTAVENAAREEFCRLVAQMDAIVAAELSKALKGV